MIPEIARKPLDHVLPSLLARYGMQNAESLGGFESYVYATADRVLKVTHTLRRDPGTLHAELHFTEHLARHGTPVARPVPSFAGHLVETHPDPEGGAWLAYALTYLPGHAVTPEDLNADVIAAWGRLTGRLHALASLYEPGPDVSRRRHWHEEPLLGLNVLPEHMHEQREAGLALIERVKSWPRTRDTYGLIHSDLHEDNVHWDGSALHAFDFDDCEYHHYLNDIAVITHTIRDLHQEGEDPDVFRHRFMSTFLHAYQAEFPLPAGWQDRMNDLVRLRDLLLLAVICEAWGVGTPHEHFEEESHRAVLGAYAERVAAGRVVVDIDWSRYASARPT